MHNNRLRVDKKSNQVCGRIPREASECRSAMRFKVIVERGETDTTTRRGCRNLENYGGENAIKSYLNFNGQCEAALKFYEQVLGGKVTFKQTWGDSPMAKHVPEESQQHPAFNDGSGGSTLMCADSPPTSISSPKEFKSPSTLRTRRG